MDIERIEPERAKELLDSDEGYTYLEYRKDFMEFPNQ